MGKTAENSNHFSKPVLQIDCKTLVVLNEYISVLSAEKATGIYRGTIYGAVNRKRRSAGGFFWCTKKDYDPLIFTPLAIKLGGGPHGIPSKPVIQMDLEGNQIKIWDNAIEAAMACHGNNANISSCCYGKAKTCMGYRWAFVIDKTIIAEVNNRRKEQWKVKYELTSHKC